MNTYYVPNIFMSSRLTRTVLSPWFSCGQKWHQQISQDGKHEVAIWLQSKLLSFIYLQPLSSPATPAPALPAPARPIPGSLLLLPHAHSTDSFLTSLSGASSGKLSLAHDSVDCLTTLKTGQATPSVLCLSRSSALLFTWLSSRGWGSLRARSVECSCWLWASCTAPALGSTHEVF